MEFQISLARFYADDKFISDYKGQVKRLGRHSASAREKTQFADASFDGRGWLFAGG
jgi:hypothetical protein